MRTLTRDQARRIALAAAGFAQPRPSGRVDARHVRRAVRTMGALQIDAVNAVARAHLLTLHARLGAFEPRLLDHTAYRRRELFEYWAHEAAYVPVDLHPLLRPRMASYPLGRWARMLLEEEPDYIDRVLAEVAERGPLSASELSDPGERRGSWWGWSKGKVALERLFANGQVSVAGRRSFTRLYDLTERVIPPDILALPTPDRDEAERELIAIAAACTGVAAAGDLADHFRIPIARARPLIADLVRAGRLREVAVEGWREPAYLHPEARLPRAVSARALLSPFDPVVWHRPRAERLFDFRYRIEIYTPEAKRVHGYYVLPFLLGDRLVARVDARADRARRVLLIPGAFAEEHVGCRSQQVADELARSLEELAAWLDLDAVEVGDRGDLARSLRRSLASLGEGGAVGGA